MPVRKPRRDTQGSSAIRDTGITPFPVLRCYWASWYSPLSFPPYLPSRPLLKIISLFTLVHYLVLVLPAPLPPLLAEEPQAKSAVAGKYHLVKPRVKNLKTGLLDIDQIIALDAPFELNIFPTCTLAVQTFQRITPPACNAFYPRAPPTSLPLNSRV